MSIRNKLLALLITGFSVLLTIFYVSNQTLNSASQKFTSDSLAQTYSAAWLSASDAQFERSVEQFDPELGHRKSLVFGIRLKTRLTIRESLIRW